MIFLSFNHNIVNAWSQGLKRDGALILRHTVDNIHC